MQDEKNLKVSSWGSEEIIILAFGYLFIQH